MATKIHGIAASEHIDSSGEKLSIAGLNISTLTSDGVFNYEHEGGEEGVKIPSQIVGKVTEAKKIFSEEDCENVYHLMYWKRCLKPYVYVAGELMDDEGHAGAVDVAAMLHYDEKNKERHERKMVNFSIEGAKLKKEGMNVFKSVARKVTITVHPCNKACEAGLKPDEEIATENDGDFHAEDFFKSENMNFEVGLLDQDSAIEKLDSLIKSSTGEMGMELKTLRNQLALAMANDSLNSTLAKKAYGKSQDAITSLRKTLTAGNYDVKPSMRTGGAALAKECLGGRDSIEVITKPKNKSNRIEREEGKIEIVKKSEKETDLDTVYGDIKLGKEKKSKKDNEKLNLEEMKGGVKSDFQKKKEKSLKKSMVENFKLFNKSENLVNFIVDKYPELSKSQVVLCAVGVANRYMKKSERSLEKMIKSCDDQYDSMAMKKAKKLGKSQA